VEVEISLDIFTPIWDAINGMLDFVTADLPTTPTFNYIGIDRHTLGIVNWFIPFDICVPIFMSFLALIAITLVVRALLTFFGFLK
jgi:hypothetical protein